MDQVPNSIKTLVERRNVLRNEGRYAEADQIRDELVRLGYEVVDTDAGTTVAKKEETANQRPKNSFLVLFGSGEIAPSGRRTHEFVFKRMGKSEISIAIITTPAGFQPNVVLVYEEIAQFFLERLQNFHPKVDIIYANTREDANNPALIAPIENADYIFTGAGSPSYAVKHLKDTVLYKKIIERVKEGATLSIASAATASFSRYCLPVYEIYKVGEPLHWMEGLNVYEELLESLTIIPHFNNTEGGEKTDTSRCWMGVERFERLLPMLPKGERTLGIDEHTSLIFDLKSKKCVVRGKGSVHDLLPEGAVGYPSGTHWLCKK